jgi:hypothetical protein
MSDSDPTGLHLFLTPDTSTLQVIVIIQIPLWGEPKLGPLGSEIYLRDSENPKAQFSI